jgi:DNA-binding GntR family transcriptional regulator
MSTDRIIRSGIPRLWSEVRETDCARGAFEHEIRSSGREPRTDTIIATVTPPPAVAALLGDGPAVCRIRQMYADDELVQLATSWIPADIAAGTPIEAADPGTGGIYSRLAELGHAPAWFTEDITASHQGTLDPGRSPGPWHTALDITRTATDASGRIVEVMTATLPADRWLLRYAWRADEH